MVYTGRPSPACRTCRLRRIKCDETRPNCIQCSKSKRECGGYPDPDDLIFQHQTSSTIKKARRAEAIAIRKREKEDSDASSNSNSTPISGSTPTSTNGSETTEDSEVVLLRPIRDDLETYALDFYLNGTIVEPASSGKYVGHLELLPKLYLQAPANSALALVVRALCLACFSNFSTERGPVMTQALEAYGTCVMALHKEMKNLQQRRKNELLMAVVSMQAVECLLSWHKAPSMQWASHVFGAACLLKGRGAEVLEDPVASKIFMVVRKFIVDGSNSRGVPLDPFFAQLPGEAVRLPNSPEVRLSPITNSMKVTRIRVLRALKSEDRADLAIRLSECQWMDEELVGWAGNIPESYSFEATDSPVGWEDLEFNLQEHRYRDTYSQRLWNSWRTARIFANVLAYRCAVVLGEDVDGPGYLWNAQAMADEICSSIPVEMRYDTTPAPSFSPSQQAVAAFFLLWPLFVARGILSLPVSQKEWIRRRMLGIAEKYQLRRTMNLVVAGDEDERRPLWMEEWEDDCIELVWESSFLYGSGAI
jgi:hypothetical protein